MVFVELDSNIRQHFCLLKLNYEVEFDEILSYIWLGYLGGRKG